MTQLLVVQWIAVALMPVVILLISWVDAKSYRIPDKLNILLGGLGVVYQPTFGLQPLLGATVTAGVVAALLLLVRHGYFLRTGQIGLGLGDVKMAAAATVWLSPWNLPLFFLVSSGSALAFTVLYHRGTVSLRSRLRIPFGPFLGLSLVATCGFELLSGFNL